MQATHTPGAAVAVVQGDRVVHLKAFGVTSVETQQPVTTNTMFRLGSTTKMFVAATAVAMANTGKVNLERPIGGLHSSPRLTPGFLRIRRRGLTGRGS